MGCQREITAGVVEQKGEYLLAVKENQPHLYEDIEQAFEKALNEGEPGVDFTEFQTKGIHGSRKETRTCCVITNPKSIRNMGLWTKLTAICMVISECEENGISRSDIRYFIGSVDTTAEQYLGWIRGHWGIEIPRPEDPRSDNLCAVLRVGYHRRRRPVGVVRVERHAFSGPRRHLMLTSESTCVPPRLRFLPRAH